MSDIEMKSGLSEIMLNRIGEKALNLGGRVLFAIVFFVIGVQIIRLIRRVVRRGMEKAKADVGVTQFLDSFLKAALYLLLVLMLAASFGVDTASIVAILGSAGVAIGLAIQGSLSNLAGGVLILMAKPFRVGDYIVEGSGGKEGTVSEIQIFYTKLVTPDNREIILPNGSLANNSIVNVTKRNCRRADIPVSVSYQADLKKAKKVLTAVLEEDAKTMKDKERLVFVDALADSGVVLNLRCWFKNEDFWQGKWRVTERAKLALDENKIEIPYPQMDVHLKNNQESS